MEKRYNLDNLEASFRVFLTAGNKNKITIKNYLSDIRHFLGWFTFYFKANKQAKEKTLPINNESFAWISLINKQTIFDYRNYMKENRLPNKSINRRLSTVRKFCSFCISQGWLKENPAKQIENVGLIERPKILTQEDVLLQFEQSLLDKNIDNQTIKNYLGDVREMLSI